MDSQKKIILDHLQNHRRITTIEAFQLYNITCLNKMIQLLRKDHAIESIWNKSANGKRYVEYYYIQKRYTGIEQLEVIKKCYQNIERQ